jgi:hypothetical protein
MYATGAPRSSYTAMLLEASELNSSIQGLNFVFKKQNSDIVRRRAEVYLVAKIKCKRRASA